MQQQIYLSFEMIEAYGLFCYCSLYLNQTFFCPTASEIFQNKIDYVNKLPRIQGCLINLAAIVAHSNV